MNRTYEEWIKYYENATKEQVIEDTMHDMEEINRLNNIITELEKYILNHYIVGHTIQNASLDDILNKLKELKEGR